MESLTKPDCSYLLVSQFHCQGPVWFVLCVHAVGVKLICCVGSLALPMLKSVLRFQGPKYKMKGPALEISDKVRQAYAALIGK